MDMETPANLSTIGVITSLGGSLTRYAFHTISIQRCSHPQHSRWPAMSLLLQLLMLHKEVSILVA